MAKENTPKVYPEPYLEDCDLTMDRLGEISNKYDSLKNKFLKTKKEDELLQDQLLAVSKEKESLSISLENTQKDLMLTRFHAKLNFLILMRMRFHR